MIVRILFFSICFFCFKGYSQDKLNLINGKSVDCYVDSIGKTVVHCTWKKKNGSKGRPTLYHRTEVYSITGSNGMEEIVFLQDTLTGYGYSLEGIKVYRQGCIDAREKINTRFIQGMGLGLGLAFVSWETNWYKEDAGAINLLFPIVYTLAIGIKKPTPKSGNVDLIQNPAYLDAYQKVGQGRKISAALKGSFAGILAGLITTGVVKLVEK